MHKGFNFKGALLSLAIVPASFLFTQDLRLGARSLEVTNLQKILNSDQRTQVGASGTGSAGFESTYFGSLTKAAVMRFQAVYKDTILTPAGLTTPTGIVGAMTRKKLNSLLTGQTGLVQALQATGTGGQITTNEEVFDPTAGTGAFKGNALFDLFALQAKRIGREYMAPTSTTSLGINTIQINKSNPINIIGGDDTIYIEGSGFETDNKIYSGLGLIQHAASPDGAHLQFKARDFSQYQKMASYPSSSGVILSIFFRVANNKGVSKDSAYFNITFK